MNNDLKADFAYKKDWAQAQLKWDAYWAREIVDRPVVAIMTSRKDGNVVPLPELPENCTDWTSDQWRDRCWMNADYIVQKALNYMEGHYFVGEAVPSAGYFMGMTTAGCDDNLYFHKGGISNRPTMTSITDPLGWDPGPNDPWRPKIAAIHDRILDAADGKFFIPTPVPGNFPHTDLLSMLRGNSELLLDMALYPNEVKEKLKEMRPIYMELNNYLRQRITKRAGNVGYSGWTKVWSREPMLQDQSDMAAALSPDMFAEFVLPEIEYYAEAMGCYINWHTCGYKQHTDVLLSCPFIKSVQYAPNIKEPPNGPAHIEFYKQVQEKGRCLDLYAGGPEEVEYCIRHLRPEGLHIRTNTETLEEAEELLANAVKWAGSHIHRSS